MSAAKDKFRLLAQRLRTYPSLDTRINPKLLFEIWKCFRSLDPANGDEITPAIMAGIILFDEESFGSLLNETELTQLTALGRVALERYQLKTNPPNQPGKLLGNCVAATKGKESI